MPATAQENGTLFPSLTLPNIGDNTLHIISPDILELVRINTKPAGTATVPDSWNFIAPNGTFTAPSASQFSVSVNDAYVGVTAVYFRRRVVYAPLFPRDMRIENRLYLKLSTPVPEGALVEVTNPGNALWPATMAFTCAASPLRPSEA
ncbi:MAG: glycoside hydrolase family 9, partial [Verrucomicrobiaceae bacterium]